MPRFSVATVAYVGVYTTVEADTIEAAKEIALSRGLRSVCHACADSDDGRKDRQVWCLSDGLGESLSEDPEHIEVTQIDED